MTTGIVAVTFLAASAAGVQPGYDQIDVAADQLRREVRETLSASMGRAIFDD
jgi:threonine/homoserine/homoserine lactone efflux protein